MTSVTKKQQKARQSQKRAGSKTKGGSHVSARSRGSLTFGVLTLLLAALIAVNVSGSLKQPERGVTPEEVLGTWTTTDSDYADRAFEIRRNSLVLYTGGSDHTVHLIENVEVDDLDGPILVRIHYSEEGGLNIFSFYYDPAGGGVITFRNQRSMQWRRGT